MRTALCVVFVFVLAAASFAGTNEYSSPGTPSATDGTFTIVYEFPLDLGDAHNVGIGFDGNYVWVAAGDYTTGTCQFYLFDDMGTLMFTFAQGAGATGWGHRDLCFDGTYMYGSYSTEIHAFDTSGNYVGYFNGPGISPCRALAYDGYYFYTSGFSEYIYRGHWDGVWGSTPTWEIISGDVIGGCYGMAYDWANACLWVTTADYSGDILQFALDGSPLGVHTTLPEYDIMGGCTMAGTASWGMVFAVLMQSDPDMVVFYDVDSTTPVEDATWSSIKAMYQ
jgi:hypothetical protein